MIASGMIRVASMSPIRRNVTLGHPSSGLGILGCTETHVHKKIVRAQLRIMSQSDLQLLGSLQDED
jgi:hypothetical protein